MLIFSKVGKRTPSLNLTYKRIMFQSDIVEKIGLYFATALGQFTRNYTQTTKRGLLTTNKG